MAYEVQVEQFSGPLELLLDLISKEELPITDVSLAQVTGDYLTYVEEHTPPAEELADFLVVAARLLQLKSREILPEIEIEEDESPVDLSSQLKMYKAFVDASAHIQALYDSPKASFARQKPLVIPMETIPFPENVTSESLYTSFTQMLKRLAPFFKLQEKAIERVVSVKERIAEFRAALLQRSRMVFRDAVKGAESKVDVVVSFLALLELVKQQTVTVVQSDSFSDIHITHAE